MGLTDGQWVHLLRELCAPWREGSHPIPELVAMLHHDKARWARSVDGLLTMRKAETVAHGSTGEEQEIANILARRLPQLQRLLELHLPLWQRLRLVAPLAQPEGTLPQQAWQLAGYTPSRGRWRLTELEPGGRVAPGELLAVGASGRPVLALHPILILRRPSPEAVEELFFLDGGDRRGARFVALPSMAQHREHEVWGSLERAFDDLVDPELHEVAGKQRPYMGLSAFGPDESALFFGRGEQALMLSNRVRRHTLLTVTGPSGSGKSSLVHAGVIPLLEGFDHLLMRPGSRPLRVLRERIANLLGRAVDSAPPTAAELGATVRAHYHSSERSLLIVVDQTEELFTLCCDEQQRQGFGMLLSALTEDGDAPLHAVLVIREDFFTRLASIDALRGLYDRHVEVVTTPGEQALQSILVEPARLFGFQFENPELVRAMVAEVAGEPAALALLQFCADRLWEQRDRVWKRLSWDAYHSLGGVAGALATHAEALFSQLAPAQQRAARSLMRELVTPERTRASVPRDDLVAVGEEPEASAGALERLLSGRLLVTRDPGSWQQDVQVELVHEALIGHWKRLSEWLEEDREDVLMRRALRAAAVDWEARGRPEGLLWSGDALAELRAWRERSAARLTERDQDFLERSNATERRQRDRRRWSVGIVTLGSLALALVALLSWQGAEYARRETVAALRRSEAATAAAEREALFARSLSAAFELHPSQRASLLRAAMSLEADEPWTEVAAQLERLALEGALARVLPADMGAVGNIAISPDGGLLAATYQSKGRARLWDLERGAVIMEVPGHAESEVLFTPSGDAWIVSDGSQLRVLPCAQGDPLQIIEGEELGSMAVSPSGRWLVTGGNRGVRLWLQRQGRFEETATFSDQPAFGLTWLREDLVAGRLTPAHLGEYPALVWWEVPSGRALGGAETEGGLVPASLIRPVLDGTALITGASMSHAAMLSVEDGSELARFEGFERSITSVRVSADGARVAVASKDRSVRTWALPSGAPEDEFWHWGSVYNVNLSSDGALLATGTIDATGTWLWDAETGWLIKRLPGHSGPVARVIFTPDDRSLLSSSFDGNLRIWDTSRLGGYTELGAGSIRHLHAVHHAGEVLRAYDDHRLQIHDAISGVLLATLEPPEPPGREDPWWFSDDGHTVLYRGGASFHALDTTQPRPAWRACGPTPEGARVVTGSPSGERVLLETAEGAHSLWEPAGPDSPTLLPGPDRRALGAAISPEGERVAMLVQVVSQSEQSNVQHEGSKLTFDMVVVTRPALSLFTAGADTQPPPIEVHENASELWFSPSGRWLAVSHDLHAVHGLEIFDAASGERRFHLDKLGGGVSALVFSADDRQLFIGTDSSEIEQWSLAEPGGCRERRLVAPEGGVRELVLSPDETRLASVSRGGEGHVRVWDLATGTVLLEQGGGGQYGFTADGMLLFGLADSHKGGRTIWWSTRSLDRAQLLQQTGAATNFRVCRGSYEPVAVIPFPTAESVWAPEEFCREERR